MLTLMIQEEDRIYSGMWSFEYCIEAPTLDRLLSHKLLRMYAGNDRILNRTTLMAVNYHDGRGYAKFSLLPNPDAY